MIVVLSISALRKWSAEMEKDIPIPLLKKGDWIRLKEPYTVQRLHGSAYQNAISHLDGGPDVDEQLRTMTHGIVVEVLSRYQGPRQIAKTGGPVRNVALHLFNPGTGLMYVGGHPTEVGKPEYVDHHVGELVLIHKHDESWSNEYEIDLAQQYEEWGIDEPAAIFEDE